MDSDTGMVSTTGGKVGRNNPPLHSRGGAKIQKEVRLKGKALLDTLLDMTEADIKALPAIVKIQHAVELIKYLGGRNDNKEESGDGQSYTFNQIKITFIDASAD